MKTKNLLVVSVGLLLSAFAVAEETVLADGWEFAQVWKDTRPASEKNVARRNLAPDAPELVWKKVRMPHDWAIEGPFDRACRSGVTGKLPWVGVGWYRRALTVPASAKGAFVALRFGGVMARPEVFLNGEKVGGWDYGYASFEVDVSNKIRFGERNELLVRADTSGHHSRWYPGAGIYRDVTLVVEDAQDRLVWGSLKITTPEISEKSATVRVEYATPTGAVDRAFAISDPVLWSPETPHLYTVRIFGKDYRYGIRTATFTADDGFHLNGKRLQLKGVNLHADLGPLGMAFNRQAARRQLAVMKEMGVNAIRTSHNPADEQFLDLCDEMGFVVWNECFDKWDMTAGIRSEKNQDECVMRNLAQFVRRDRNHPSVVCWSIGNEIVHRWEKFPSGTTPERCAKYRAAVLKEDATRPVGIGCFRPASIDHGDYDALDLTGWNYKGLYAEMRAKRPEKPLVYSESASAVSGWGYYHQPLTRSPSDYGATRPTEIDAYDRTAAKSTDIADVEFARMERDRYCAGEFVWTGIDYLGEPTPNDADNRSSFFGVCDLTALPKDRYWLYRSHWNDGSPTVHLLPHWNWEGLEGTNVTVMCYTSGDEAELFLNGESQGRRRKLEEPPPLVDKKHPDYYKVCDRYRLMWEVPYRPGEIKVVAYKNGAPIGAAVRRTAGKAARVTLLPEAKTAGEGDLTFVRVGLADAKGNPLPLAHDRVSFKLEGPGELVAVANGSTSQMDSFTDTSSHRLHFGRALVIVRRTGSGALKLTGSVPTLPSATLTLAGEVSAPLLAQSEWISVKEAPVHEAGNPLGLAAPGTSWFARRFANKGDIASAKWTVTGLGVFDVYVNGARVGNDFLKPGFTHNGKTKYAFAYDVTDKLRTARGAENVLAAEVSSGWWRDRICSPGKKDYWGKKSAFRGELELVYADGRRETIGTRAADWKSGVAGGVVRAGIFDGEVYDARLRQPTDGEGLTGTTEVNGEFKGEILPTAGAEVALRRDLAMTRGPYALKKGETLVVDFGQNCAGVPEFRFKAPRGTILTALPGEMLNDADAGSRGCDGPKGSVYRANLRSGEDGMRIDYTFAGDGTETYLPRFTYFGYRYLSIEATDDVEILSVASIPVSSVRKEHEIGTLEVGDKALDRFVSNVRWGQRSNYLSIPTDCPQRNERLGWSADTQIFAEAGSYLADTRGFFRKWMRDMRDSQSKKGGFPSAAPLAQFANEPFKFGWADAGVIVPHVVWRHFGDTRIVAENWDAMMKFLRAVDEKKYDFEDEGLPYPIYSDWLSLEKYEVSSNKRWRKYKGDPDARKFRRFLAGCYWLGDARKMAAMGAAAGMDAEDVAWCRASADRARAYLKANFFEADGRLLTLMREMQTPSAFALFFDLLEGEAKTATLAWLVRSVRENNATLRTGFLGTTMLMDALAKEGRFDVAYDILLQHGCPGWLYSVDQGATTVWERWNSYTKKDGFGPAGMNSFNHYAYGAVLAWIYRHAAGIAPAEPGFKKIVLAPKPDRRLGFVRASCKTAAGLVTSAWRYEGDAWIWEFAIPEGATATVTVPGRAPAEFGPGKHVQRLQDSLSLQSTFDRPAKNWEESLLTGNGTIGAMVRGDPVDETITLSHCKLFRPNPGEKAPVLVNHPHPGRRDYKTRDGFMAACELKILVRGRAGRQYERRTDFSTGECIVETSNDPDRVYRRRVVALRPSNVIAVKIDDDDGRSHAMMLRGVPPNGFVETRAFVGGVKSVVSRPDYYRCEFAHANPWNPLAGYEVLMLKKEKGRGHTELFIAIEPLKKGETTNEPVLRARLEAAAEKGYEALLAEHAPRQKELMDRVSFSLTGPKDAARIVRNFQSGRYNVISSTGGDHVPHLQGLWAGTWNAPWFSSFTVNGNLPCAISFFNRGRTPEFNACLFRWLEARLPEMREAAKLHYKARGFRVAAQITLAGVETDSSADFPHVHWHGGAAWLLSRLYDGYRHTLDKNWLARIYPLMKEVAEYYEDVLVDLPDGTLGFNPSYSPENWPKGMSPTTVNATMDNAIAKQFLDEVVAAAEILGRDVAAREKWRTLRARLTPYAVSDEGFFAEWLAPGHPDNNEHRHASHLYALYDEAPAEIVTNAAFVAAIGKTIDARMDFNENRSRTMAFGYVHNGLAACKIGDGERAARCLQLLTDKNWLPGGGSSHDWHKCFNTDISGGYPYLISDMLVRSDDRSVTFLPAKPKSWTSGAIRGLLLRGNVVLEELSWNGGEFSAVLKMPTGETTRLNGRAGQAFNW